MQKGTQMTKKSKELIRKAVTGVSKSPEHCKALSKARREWWRKRKLSKGSTV